MHPRQIVFYDGDCGLCQRSVQWLMRHDRAGRLVYAPLGGETATAALANITLPPNLDSIVFYDDGKAYVRSRAIFRIVRYLDPGVRYLRHFGILPAFLTDLGYRFIAAIRYRVWGRADTCRVPTASERQRLLP